MGFILETSHRDFFIKHGHIAFVDLFSANILLEAENSVLGNFRDLWRMHSAIKAVALHKNCAKIVAELTNSKVIRIAYDQSLCVPSESLSFSKSPFSFEDISCIQPILCIMVLRLSQGPTFEKDFPYCPSPKERGEALFVSGKMLVTLEPLVSEEMQKFLFVAYSNARPQYIDKKRDPFVNSLKRLGYSFGDHLKVSTHPIIYSQR